MPERIQLSRKKGWRMPENTVKVSRPSYWGNPWIVGIDGDAAHCVAEYRRLLTGNSVLSWPKQSQRESEALRFNDDAFACEVLRGKNLACWCKLDQPCHADVLLQLANGPQNSASVRPIK